MQYVATIRSGGGTKNSNKTAWPLLYRHLQDSENEYVSTTTAVEKEETETTSRKLYLRNSMYYLNVNIM